MHQPASSSHASLPPLAIIKHEHPDPHHDHPRHFSRPLFRPRPGGTGLALLKPDITTRIRKETCSSRYPRMVSPDRSGLEKGPRRKARGQIAPAGLGGQNRISKIRLARNAGNSPRMHLELRRSRRENWKTQGRSRRWRRLRSQPHSRACSMPSHLGGQQENRGVLRRPRLETPTTHMRRRPGFPLTAKG